MIVKIMLKGVGISYNEINRIIGNSRNDNIKAYFAGIFPSNEITARLLIFTVR